MLKLKNMKEKTQKNFDLFQSIIRLIKKHKIKSSIIIILGLLIIVTIFLYVGLNLIGGMKTSYDSMAPLSQPSTQPDSTRSAPESISETDEISQPDETLEDEIPGIKIIEAGADIETDDAVKKEKKITDITKQHNGYSEQSRFSESRNLIRIDMTLRIPANNFEGFFNELRESSEIENFNVRDYRIDIERRETRLSTIRETIEMYDEMIEETKQMEMNTERIDLTKRLTDEKMRLVRQENDLLDSLGQSKRRSDYSTINLTIRQDISPKIWPEDIGKRFRENLQDSFDKIADSVTKAVGNILNIFVTAILWIVYVIVVILPIWIAYRLLKRSYIFFYQDRE